MNVIGFRVHVPRIFKFYVVMKLGFDREFIYIFYAKFLLIYFEVCEISICLLE